MAVWMIRAWIADVLRRGMASMVARLGAAIGWIGDRAWDAAEWCSLRARRWRRND